MNKRLYNDLYNTLIALQSYLLIGVFYLESKERIEEEIEAVLKALQLIKSNSIKTESELKIYLKQLI